MDQEWKIDLMRATEVQKKDEERDWGKQSIYGMPSFSKDKFKNTYDPLLLSIGPFHHGKPHLVPMESHKRRALQHFITRSNKSLEFYVKEMKSVEQQVRDSYEQLYDQKWRDSNKFLQLMITDGCFILEFMEILSGAPKDYADNDPVFSYYGSLIHYNVVMRDLLLVENQLPYIVLKKLLIIAESPQDFPDEIADKILSQIMMFGPDVRPGAHMLDMYMEGLFQGRRGSNGDDQKDNEDQKITESPPTASQLSEAGILFKKVGNFNDIKFDRDNGTLHLPQLNINEYTVSTFLNLKAFELRGTTGRNFNSYIKLMETLMQSVKDVEVLGSVGIVVNLLGRKEEVVKLMKELGKDTVVDENCASYEAQKEMNRYYEVSMKQWEKEVKKQVLEWLSNLHQTYFRTPWSTISVVAAGFLLALAMVQTIYTLKSFFKMPN